jgi:Holliday junction DNA helicase RuvA
MIAYLRGKLSHIQSDSLVVEVGGIGYKVSGCFPSAINSFLPSLGEDILVHTHLHVREDDIQLYGFLDIGQLQTFQQLLTISGIGPKSALSIVSSVVAEDLAKAIISEDLPFLTRLPGVGKKTGQRLIFELKEKIIKAKAFQIQAEQVGKSGDLSRYYETIEALSNLGYHSQEVIPYLNVARKELGEQAEVSQLIKFVLKRIGTG